MPQRSGGTHKDVDVAVVCVLWGASVWYCASRQGLVQLHEEGWQGGLVLPAGRWPQQINHKRERRRAGPGIEGSLRQCGQQSARESSYAAPADNKPHLQDVVCERLLLGSASISTGA